MNKYQFHDKNGVAHTFPEITGQTFRDMRGKPGLPEKTGPEFFLACAMDRAAFMDITELLAGAKPADLLEIHIVEAINAWIARVSDFYQGLVDSAMLTAMVQAASLNAYLGQLRDAIGGLSSSPDTVDSPTPIGDVSVSVS